MISQPIPSPVEDSCPPIRGTAKADGDKRFRELDGVRGFAILIVLCHHYFTNLLISIKDAPLVAWQERLMQAFRLGSYGVDLFFVLSGFLITKILMDNRQSPVVYRTFFVRRFCRILPLTVAVVAVVFLLRGLLSKSPATDWLFEGIHPALSYLTFTQNFLMGHTNSFGGNALGVTWSLAVEEQFYLVLPFAICLIPSRLFPWLALTAIPLAWLLRMQMHDLRSYVWLFGRCDALLVGSLLACLHSRVETRRALSRSAAGLYVLWGGLALGVVYISTMPEYFGTALHTWFAAFWGATVAILVFVPETPLGTIFRMRWLGFVGTISFGVYLFHELTLGLTFHFLRGEAPFLRSFAAFREITIAATLTFIFATLSYYLFERRFLGIGRAFRY